MPENKELLKEAVREGMPASTIGIGRPSNALTDSNPPTTPVGNPCTPDQLISMLYLACKCSVRSMDSEREARKKCQRCYLVWRVVQRYCPGWAGRPDVSYKFAPNNALELRLCSVWKGDYHAIEAIYETTFYIYTVSFCLKLNPGPLIMQPIQQQSPPLTMSSNSGQCFSFIKERLENCRTRHSSCIPKNALPLPKRIIVVGKPGEEPTLHDIGNVQGPYAILSYCWGKSQHLLKTTSTSLDKHKKGISLTQLPKTIRDAVYITRELAIDYLWVDSLCILQDSVEDWEVESAKMGEYFKNAHITIAASHASHAQDGILRGRREITQSVEEQYELVDGTICNIVIQERNHSYEKLESFVHDFGPLSKRGWAFQENVLSTRTVHYTDSELVWECCTETISEDGSTLGRNQHSILAYNMLNLQPSPSRLWRDLVENYTRRDLTYPSDRLPGIAGIAQIMQSRTGFQYIAGLWKETLVLDLLWSTSWPHYNKTPEGLTGWTSIPSYEDPPVTLRGPSWSWASTTAAIRFAPSEDVWLHDQCAMIKDVNCKAEGDNLFGEVIHGSLQLVGLLRQMHFKCSDPQKPYFYQISTIRPQNPDHHWIHTVHNDDKAETADFTPDKLLIGKEASEYRRLLDKPVWCLGICKSYGVILRESTVIDGAYTRIGLCKNVGSLLQGAHTKLITIT